MKYEKLNFRESWMLGAAVGLALEDYPWSAEERSTIQEALDKLPHLEKEPAPLVQNKREEKA